MRRDIRNLLLICAIGAASPAVAHESGQVCPLDFTLPYVLPTASSGSLFPLASIPAYNSLAGAGKSVYLDFVGETSYDWNGYAPGVTPAYDTDGDPTTFSAQELSNVHEIWQRVSEKFSPFNINVTTVDPGVYNHLETTKVVIGGDGTNGQSTYWAGGKYGGIAWVGGFSNTSLPNTVYVFSGNLGNGDPKTVGEASSHETGHSFGLNHQSVWSGTTKVNEYNPGSPAKAPIMGRSYESARGLWWKGTSSILWNQIQDDIDVVNGVLGFRDDDHGNDTASATPLSIVSNTLSAAGIIENMPDRDWFSFTTDGGGAAFNVNPFSPGGMLDASLYLYNADGTLIASSATTNLSESLTLTLTAGTYEVVVGGAGRYGDIGQYTLEGTFGLVPEPASIASLFLLVAFARRRRVPESESRNGGAAL